jgi:hypothetical protein
LPDLTIDDMRSAAAWQALASDGVTASAALAIAADSQTQTPSGDGQSLVAERTAPALNHRLHRTIGPLDLSAWPELRLELQADVATGMRADSAFFLELRLGSAAAPIGTPANEWNRRLPIERAQRWEAPRLSLDDLPAAVRGAVDRIELRCVSNRTLNCRSASGSTGSGRSAHLFPVTSRMRWSRGSTARSAWEARRCQRR